MFLRLQVIDRHPATIKLSNTEKYVSGHLSAIYKQSLTKTILQEVIWLVSDIPLTNQIARYKMKKLRQWASVSSEPKWQSWADDQFHPGL